MAQIKAYLRRLSGGDLAILGAIAVFALLAVALHSSDSGLGEMARGITQTGQAIQSGGRATAEEVRDSVGQAADALSGFPVVGGGVADRVRETASTTAEVVERETRVNGGLLVSAGRQGERDVRSTARLVGWLAFLIPTVLLLAQWIPRRLPVWRAEAALAAREVAAQ